MSKKHLAFGRWHLEEPESMQKELSGLMRQKVKTWSRSQSTGSGEHLAVNIARLIPCFIRLGQGASQQQVQREWTAYARTA